MAYSAERTTNGFEIIGNLTLISDNGRDYLLTPGVAFTKGDMVTLTNGKVAKAAANATNVLGVMAESIAAADNPSGTATYGKVFDSPFDVFRCSFADQVDSTATGAGSTTTITDSVRSETNNYWVGALLYIYAGAGAGNIRTISGSATAGTLTWLEPLGVATDTTTKYIILGAATGAAGNVINIGSVGVDLKDENTIDANATIAAEAGPLAVLDIDPVNLTMDVIIRKHRWNSV